MSKFWILKNLVHLKTIYWSDHNFVRILQRIWYLTSFSSLPHPPPRPKDVKREQSTGFKADMIRIYDSQTTCKKIIVRAWIKWNVIFFGTLFRISITCSSFFRFLSVPVFTHVLVLFKTRRHVHLNVCNIYVQNIIFMDLQLFCW